MFKERELNSCLYHLLLEEGYDDFIAGFLAKRLNSIEESRIILNYASIKDLQHPLMISDMNKATLRIIRAIKNHEKIGIQTDYDCDGQTSQAIIYKSLSEIFGHEISNLVSFIGDRLKEGYGLTQILAQQIIAQNVTLLITADNGSTDVDRIRFLQQHNIDVIITDHHIVRHKPKDAFAFVNPASDANPSTDPYVAGCMVAWFLMASVYCALMKDHYPCKYSIIHLLDYVALGTLADCVSLRKSRNNRIAIKYGLQIMNHYHKDIWLCLKHHFKIHEINSETIQFYIAPLINSASRVGIVFDGIKFLLARTYDEACQYLAILLQWNSDRIHLQNKLFSSAQAMILSRQLTKKIVCLYLEESHPGINGIIANKILDLTGRTTVVFSPKENILVGSMRAADQVSLLHALEKISTTAPNLLIKFGGHHKAAGICINKENLPLFEKYFEKEIHALMPQTHNNADIIHDGPVPNTCFNTLHRQITSLAPYGIDFAKPLFYNHVTLITQKLLSKGLHILFKIKIHDTVMPAIMFNIKQYDWLMSLQENDVIQICYHVEWNNFKDAVQLIIKHITFKDYSTQLRLI